jgi:Bacterial Ig domain
LTDKYPVHGLESVSRPAARTLVAFLLSATALAAANPQPVVSITAPLAGENFIIPSSVSLMATASSPDASPIVSVTYSSGTTKIGTSTVSPFTLAWKPTVAGTVTITAVAKDKLGVSSAASAPVTFSLTKDPGPTVTLITPPSGSAAYGPRTVILTATATPVYGSIKSVTYSENGKAFGTSTAALYKYTWTKVPVGSHTVSAVATDTFGEPSAPSTTTFTINQEVAPTVTIATPQAGFTTYGPVSIPLTATASSSDDSVVSVAYSYDGTKIGTSTTAPSYKVTWAKAPVGTHTLTATATDSLGVPGTASITVVVNTDPAPIVAILQPSNGSSMTGPVTGPTNVVFTASATSPSGEPFKSVAYVVGTTTIGTATKTPYSYTWKTAPMGSSTVTAVATDILGTPGSSSPVTFTLTQDQLPLLSFITPLNGSTYSLSSTIGLSANSSSPDVKISNITYYQNGTKIAASTTSPYLVSWKPTVAGTYSVTAVATDTVGGVTNAGPILVTVNSTSSTIKVTKPANGAVVVAGNSVALTASATATAGVSNVAYFAGSTPLGTATVGPSYAVTWNNAPAGVYYVTAVATDKLGAALTSSPISLRVDQPPATVISTPASGSNFIYPASIDIVATAPGTIKKMEFYENGSLLATSTTAPYSFTWTGGALGVTYSLTAEAYDSYGIGGTSPPVRVSVVSEAPPVISLTTPTSGLTFGSTSNVSLSFNATASTSISKIEVYRNGALVATLTSAASGSSWVFTEGAPLPSGKYNYFARAYDSIGNSTETPTIVVSVLPTLPYLTDFEIADGFAIGSLDGQAGWSVPQGSANISSNADSGNQGVQLVGGSPATIAQSSFAPTPGETVEFCDFYAKPAAESTIAASTVFIAEGAEFGFLQSGGAGVLQVFHGDGNGGGTWAATSFSIPLNTSNQAQSWVHLTARLDFAKQTWDIYANGIMIAADIPFISKSSTYFSTLQLLGDSANDSFFDFVYIGASNPLFNDANNDGIDDAWESQYGLSLTSNDRNTNLSGDGVSVLQDYINGKSPLINTVVLPPPVQSGLILDLRADAGVVADSNGNVGLWCDQSALGNSAVQTNLINKPLLTANQVNGYPVLNFNGNSFMALPYNMMQNAQAGEIVGVVQFVPVTDNFNVIWNFGTNFGTGFFNLTHFDDFGTNDSTGTNIETQAQISEYFMYDTSTGGGTTTYRYNGVPLWTRTGLTQGFQLTPYIGGFAGGSFVGNIAEILVYNRVLSDAERFQTGQYLNSKYRFPAITPPAAPTDLLAAAVSSDTVDLSWTAPYQMMHTVTTITRTGGVPSSTQTFVVNDALGYVDTGLTPGATYSYQLSIQSYVGTSGASNAATVTTPVSIADLPQNGMTLWLRSTAGTEGAGPLSVWFDESGTGNAAIQTVAGNQPTVVDNQANGLPVVRFNGGDNLPLPQNMMGTALSGQIFGVVKVTGDPNNFGTVWSFGTAYGSSFASGVHLDDFGNSDGTGVALLPIENINRYFIYDTSIDTAGNLTYRYDGTATWSRATAQPGSTSPPVAFQLFPSIGSAFIGDIAEVILYNRVLSSQEQAVVYAYLANKYGISAAQGNLNGPTFTSPLSETISIGQSFSYQITATNNPTSLGAANLPAGLMVSPSGLISGTPTTVGTYPVTLTAGNGSGNSNGILTLVVAPPPPVITIPALLTAPVGKAYSYQVQASNSPTSYVSTGLPAGLTMDANGNITGTPTTSGVYPVSVTVTNPGGQATANFTISVFVPGAGQNLPYTTGFETADAYIAGSVDSQNSWKVTQGSASITTAFAHIGTQSLSLDGGASPAIAALAFSQLPSETVEFCDFYATPAVDASVANSTLFTVEGAQFAFAQVNGVGVLQVFYGDGMGGGDWVPTDITIALNPVSQSASWVRLTVRLNFANLSWDLYLNGTVAASGIPFVGNSATYLSKFTIQGDASVQSWVDDLFVGPTNPLFTDANNDGIPDDWETANGLDLSVNDAGLHTFSPTLTNLQVYQLGLNPARGTTSVNGAVQLDVYTPND